MQDLDMYIIGNCELEGVIEDMALIEVYLLTDSELEGIL